MGWPGPRIYFFITPFLGESRYDRDHPSNRDLTDTATYVAPGHDWEFTRAILRYLTPVSRAIRIDMQTPSRSSPYHFIHFARRVSLYYISATTYSVKLAVSTRWH